MKKHHIKALFLSIIALCYVSNTEAATCSAYKGPNGARECVKFPGYIDYQWATCRHDSYIKSTTGNRHHCRNRDHIYCWYQCMIGTYGIDSGLVLSSCRCTPGENSASQKEKTAFVFVVLVALICQLLS